MGDAVRSHQSRSKPTDPRARERLREAQAVEARTVAAVYGAESRVERAAAKRDRAREVADVWVTDAVRVLDRARADLVSVSGVDRAALLLGLSRSELRRSLATASTQDGAA